MLHFFLLQYKLVMLLIHVLKTIIIIIIIIKMVFILVMIDPYTWQSSLVQKSSKSSRERA